MYISKIFTHIYDDIFFTFTMLKKLQYQKSENLKFSRLKDQKIIFCAEKCELRNCIGHVVGNT